MGFNVFAGARRIAIVIGVLGSVGIIWPGIYNSATVVAVVEFQPDRFTFPKWDNNYPPLNESEKYFKYSTFTTNNGTEVYLFGRKQSWIKYIDSPSCEAYAQELVESLSPYHGYLDKQYKWAKFRQIKKALEYSGYYVISLIIFTWVVGWVVRGFAGIPMGQDFKSKLIGPKSAD